MRVDSSKIDEDRSLISSNMEILLTRTTLQLQSGRAKSSK
jgi:hypothetical protein